MVTTLNVVLIGMRNIPITSGVLVGRLRQGLMIAGRHAKIPTAMDVHHLIAVGELMISPILILLDMMNPICQQVQEPNGQAQ